MPDPVMPDDYAGTGDALGRLREIREEEGALICSTCSRKYTCNKSPLRRWCVECKKFGCFNYANPTISCGSCSHYQFYNHDE